MAYVFTGKSLYDIIEKAEKAPRPNGHVNFNPFEKDIETILHQFNKTILIGGSDSTMPIGIVDKDFSLCNLLPKEHCTNPIFYDVRPSIERRLEQLGLDFKQALDERDLKIYKPDILAVRGQRYADFIETKHTMYTTTILLSMSSEIYLAIHHTGEHTRLRANELFFRGATKILNDLSLPHLNKNYLFKLKNLLRYITINQLDCEKDG